MTHTEFTAASLPSAKSDSAYKTIREVSQMLGVPQHVLRFWEAQFPQIKPSRMRGSRRYYRPQDVAMLLKIKTLLYAEGYTIKGAKKLLRENLASMAATQMAEPEPPSARKPRTPQESKMLASELRVLKSMLVTLL